MRVEEAGMQRHSALQPEFNLSFIFFNDTGRNTEISVQNYMNFLIKLDQI
jgi:hypothetical protein